MKKQVFLVYYIGEYPFWYIPCKDNKMTIKQALQRAERIGLTAKLELH